MLRRARGAPLAFPPRRPPGRARHLRRSLLLAPLTGLRLATAAGAVPNPPGLEEQAGRLVKAPPLPGGWRLEVPWRDGAFLRVPAPRRGYRTSSASKFVSVIQPVSQSPVV